MKKMFLSIIKMFVNACLKIQLTKNIKIFFFFIIFLFCIHVAVHAQSKIHGEVVDSVGKPISQANILLLAIKDSSLVKGILTKEDGSYFFENVSAGKYLI